LPTSAVLITGVFPALFSDRKTGFVILAQRRSGAEVSSSVQRRILTTRSHSVKKRVKGKTCYYFKLIESQEELDALMAQDLEDWKKFMKDNGAWEE
jgi:hypothetical protein